MPRPKRKDLILTAATVLFAEKGYEATSVRDVARRSGMLSGSLYAHFTAKEDLLFEILSQRMELVIGTLGPIVESDAPPREKLRLAIGNHLRQAANDLSLARIVDQWKSLSAPRRMQIIALRDRYGALWQRIIDEGIASGDFAPHDRKFAFLVVVSVANWSQWWFNPSGPLTPEETADMLTQVLMRGLDGAA